MDEKRLELLRQYAENPDSIQNASLDEKATYVDLVIEGCAHNIPEALEIMAYACYGGNGIFECDWNKSEECLLKLIQLSDNPNPYYHYSLGNIYLYGQGYNGIPDYEKAFKHFTMGAMSANVKSICKLSDMFVQGIGIPQDLLMGVGMLIDIHPTVLERLCDGDYACNYADVAVRFGRIMEMENDDDDEGANLRTAFSYYNCAKYTMALCKASCKDRFDDQLEAEILSEYERVKALLPADYIKDELIVEHPKPILDMLEKSVGLDIELFEKDGKWYMHGARLAGEGNPRYVLIKCPEIEYCGLVNEFTLRVIGISEDTAAEYAGKPVKVYIDEIRGDGYGTWEFIYGDSVLMKVECEGFGVGKK